VAKTKNKSKGSSVDPNEALKNLEKPKTQWRVILQIAGALVAVWMISAFTMQWTGIWILALPGILTLVAAGFGFYIWRLTRQSSQIFDILKGATDADGRKNALARLGEKGKGKGGAAMNALARAQLVAATDPNGAIEVLEEIDIAKAPALMQSDIRANLALLYLGVGRVAEARPLVEEIRLDRAPQAKSKAMYAAVIAECHARSRRVAEAQTLMETYSPDDPAYSDVAALLHRARVYTFVGAKKRGLAKKSMEAMVAMDPNTLAGFLQKKGSNPEISKMARGLLAKTGLMPKPQMARGKGQVGRRR
jgi:hypothetical protein